MRGIAALLAVLSCGAGLLWSREAAAQEVFRDCAVCPDMVMVPAGRFTMGAAPGEEEREGLPEGYRGRSAPQIEIDVPSFALGRTEVTRGQFAAFVRETGYDAGTGCAVLDWSEGTVKFDPSKHWRDPGFTQADSHPVVCVNWDGASAYVAWLAGKTGKAYRLPSEAEWEYAARAGSQAVRPWGNSSSDSCAHANVWDRSATTKYDGAITMYSCRDGFANTAPVGAFAANRFGLHDMIGNVWEWVQDCWNGTLKGIPASGAARLSGDCSRRVARGGSWVLDPWSTRSAYRDRDVAGMRASFTGFRVARTR